MTEDLVDLPRRSRATFEVAELEVPAGREIERLQSQLATLQLKLAQSESLVEQKTKDVSTMHAYGTRHADCLRSLSQALQPIAARLQQQQQRGVSDDSRVLEEARTNWPTSRPSVRPAIVARRLPKTGASVGPGGGSPGCRSPNKKEG